MLVDCGLFLILLKFFFICLYYGRKYFENVYFAIYYDCHNIVICNYEFTRIKNKFVVHNFIMKYPKGKKYASNTDEKETFLPSQYDLETKYDEPITK